MHVPQKSTHSESLSIKLTGLWHTLTDLWPGRRPRGHHKVSVNQMPLINPETEERLVQRKHRQQVCRYMSNYLQQHEHPARKNVSKISEFISTPSFPFVSFDLKDKIISAWPCIPANLSKGFHLAKVSKKTKHWLIVGRTNCIGVSCNKRAQGPDSSFGSRW